ncbi:MAG: ribonuclease III [Cycloclasticus sp. symbiont of Poecilosclerida sp. M]|nr:MAG: ribonuclease III [Cycloclasticus sp. symbiont of Poecilosclerida sp. M]
MSFELERLRKKLSISFRDTNLLEQAVTHRSVGDCNNERLEFLGDSVLGFVVAAEIYKKFPHVDEGIMSRLRASLVNKDTLAELATDLDLGEDLILGQGELKSGGRRRPSILSDALEAIIGALYLDAGLDEASKWVQELLKDRLECLSVDTATKDPKTQLQEFLQERGQTVPNYHVVSASGLDHNQTFKVSCKVSLLNKDIVTTGKSRKKAEQKAAEKTLAELVKQNA